MTRLERPPATTAFELVVVLGIFIGLTLAWVWPWPLHLSTHLVAAPYWWDGQLNTYILAEAAHNLWTNPAELFQARILHPAPDVLAYSENLLTFAVLAGPLSWLGSSPLAIHGALMLLGVALTGTTTYAWLRRHAGPAAALVGAALFVFAPFRLGYLSRIQLAVGFVVPCVLIAAERLIARPSGRRAIALGLLVTVQCGVSLYGAVHLAFFLVPTALVWGIVRVATDRSVRSPRLAVSVVLGLAVSLAGAAYIASAYHRVSKGQDFHRDEKMLAGTSGRYADLTTTSDMMVGGEATAWKVDEKSAREPIAAPGRTLMVLAALGLLVAFVARPLPRRAPGALTYALWLPLAMLVFLGTGPDAPGGGDGLYQWLLKHLPGLEGFRYSSRVVATAALPLALLASTALDWLASRLPARLGALPAVLVAVSAFLELRTKPLVLHEQEALEPVYAWSAAVAGGDALVELPFTRGRHEPRVLQDLGVLVHGLPTLNGYTGYDPPLLRYEKERLSGFPDLESEELLRSAGVDRVIVHLHLLPAGEAEALLGRVRMTPWLATLRSDSADLLLEVVGVPDGRAAEVRAQARSYASERPAPPAGERTHWTLESHGKGINIESLRDSKSNTRFTTAAVQVGGAPWMTLRFPAPRAVSEVWFDLRQGALDAPLGLRITGLVRGADGLERTTLLYDAPFHAPVVPLAAMASAAFDRVEFPSTVIDGLSISGVHDSPDRWGSIHEVWVGP